VVELLTPLAVVFAAKVSFLFILTQNAFTFKTLEKLTWSHFCDNSLGCISRATKVKKSFDR